MSPLTDEEKNFAEKNHKLIFTILRRFNLPEDDYDIAAEAYIVAVRTWFKRQELREKYAFGTIFGNAMRGVLSRETSNRTAEKRIAPIMVYIDATAREDGGTIESVIPDMMDAPVEDLISDLEPRLRKVLNRTENTVLSYLLLGYTRREIGARMGCSATWITYVVSKIRSKTLVVQGAAV